MREIVLTLFTTLLMVTGQMLFKLGSAGKDFSSPAAILKVIFTPYILLALSLYAGTTVLWMYILSRAPLSKVYPIQSLAFGLVLILSALFLRESVPLNRWIGVGIILIGVFVATMKG